jgi:DNA-binding response OmpR family regulator
MHAVAPDEGADGQHGSPAPSSVSAPTMASQPAAQPAVAAHPATRVLIVDDEPAMLRALLINLRARSYDVTTAPTGRTALALVGSQQLLTEVWGPGFEHSTNYLRFHMARLRRKLEEVPARPRYLLTEPGMGYRYQP